MGIAVGRNFDSNGWTSLGSGSSVVPNLNFDFAGSLFNGYVGWALSDRITVLGSTDFARVSASSADNGAKSVGGVVTDASQTDTGLLWFVSLALRAYFSDAHARSAGYAHLSGFTSISSANHVPAGSGSGSLDKLNRLGIVGGNFTGGMEFRMASGISLGAELGLRMNSASIQSKEGDSTQTLTVFAPVMLMLLNFTP